MPAHPIPAETDFVQELLDLAAAVIGLEPATRAALESQIRAGWGGETITIRKTPPGRMAQIRVYISQGHSIAEASRQFTVARSTVYRAIAGDEK